MPLPSSGAIGLFRIREEIRGAANEAEISLLDANVRSLADQPTGDVVMPTDFYGKSVIPPPAYSVSAAPNPVDEGAVLIIQVSTLNYYTNYSTNTIYWRMVAPPGSSISNSDFGGGYQLSTFYSMELNSSGIGTAAVQIVADQIVDGGSDSFYVQLSVDQTNIVYTSALIDINDTSVPPPACGPYTSTIVTGSLSGGNVWGSNPYTDDSDWNKAAVHAGLVGVGQTIEITRTSAGYLSSFTGSTQNGVTTSAYSGGWCGVTIASAATFSVTLSPATVNEGSGVTGTIVTTKFTGDIYWRIIHVTSSDTDFGNSAVTSGVNNTHTTFSYSTSNIGFIPLADQTTEGDETFYVVLSLTAGGPAIATSNTVTIADTSQTPPITYAITTPKTRVSEGDTVTFTITTTNYGSGTLYWRIPANLTNSQFSGISTNTYYPVTITNNSGTIQVTIVVDSNVETGYDNFIVWLYNTVGGSIVAASPLMEVVDVRITGPATANINVPFNVVFTNGVPGSTFTWVQMWTSEPRTVYGPETFDANGSNTITVQFVPGNAAPFTYTYRFTFAANSNQLDYSVYLIS